LCARPVMPSDDSSRTETLASAKALPTILLPKKHTTGLTGTSWPRQWGEQGQVRKDQAGGFVIGGRGGAGLVNAGGCQRSAAIKKLLGHRTGRNPQAKAGAPRIQQVRQGARHRQDKGACPWPASFGLLQPRFLPGDPQQGAELLQMGTHQNQGLVGRPGLEVPEPLRRRRMGRQCRKSIRGEHHSFTAPHGGNKIGSGLCWSHHHQGGLGCLPGMAACVPDAKRKIPSRSR
jgi:hypothetical protein